MGGIFSYLLCWKSPSPSYGETPHPITGLSEKDCHAIMDTWDLVAGRYSIKQNGVKFFIVLFKTHPRLLNFFPAFKALSEKEMKQSPALRARATSFMYALKSYVDTVDDAETLTGLMNKMTMSHVPRGVKVEDVKDLCDVFLDFMKADLGTKWTPEVAMAWKQLLAVHCVLYKKFGGEFKTPGLISSV